MLVPTSSPASSESRREDPLSIEAHAHSIYQGLTINTFLLQGQAINVGVGVAGFVFLGGTTYNSGVLALTPL